MLASTSPLWKVKCCTFSDTLTAAHLEKLVALFSQLHSLLLLRPELVHHLRDQDAGAGTNSALLRALAGELDLGAALPAKHHWVNIRTYVLCSPTDRSASLSRRIVCKQNGHTGPKSLD